MNSTVWSALMASVSMCMQGRRKNCSEHLSVCSYLRCICTCFFALTYSTRPLQKKILLHCIFNKDVAMIFFFCNKDFHLHVKWEKGGRELCKISMKKKNLRKNTSQHVSKHKIKCFYFPSYKACQEQVYVMLQLKYSELACAGIWGVNQSPT